VYCSNFFTSALFALLPLISNHAQLRSLWPSLDHETVSIITVTVATLFVAQATFTWTYSRIPFLYWNHMQNSRRLHKALLQFTAQVSSSEVLDPHHLMLQLKLWSTRHGELLDARCALDSTFSGQFGILLFGVLGLAATLVGQLFWDKLGFNNLQTECGLLLCLRVLHLLTIAAGLCCFSC
jgi:hypothetical protein